MSPDQTNRDQANQEQRSTRDVDYLPFVDEAEWARQLRLKWAGREAQEREWIETSHNELLGYNDEDRYTDGYYAGYTYEDAHLVDENRMANNLRRLQRAEQTHAQRKAERQAHIEKMRDLYQELREHQDRIDEIKIELSRRRSKEHSIGMEDTIL